MFLLKSTAKTPPTGFNQYLFMMYSYQGDCSSTAAQASVKQQLITLCGGKCNIDGVKVRCGAADAVRRRKRSNIKQLTMEVTIKVTTTADKAAQVFELDILAYNKDVYTSDAYILVTHIS